MFRWTVGHETFQRIRRAPATIGTDGRPVQGAVEGTLEFKGTRAPVPDEILALVPEGERQAGVMFMITETEVRSTDDNTGQAADYLLVDGELWEVREVSWFPRVIPHYEARIMRIKGTSGLSLAQAVALSGTTTP